MTISKLTNTILTIALFIFIFIIIPCVGEYNDTHYTMNGIVVEANAEEIIIEDITGNLWCIFEKGYNTGDSLKITFYTNYTNTTRKDDEIIKVKKVKNNWLTKATNNDMIILSKEIY